jgi:maleate isomerase
VIAKRLGLIIPSLNVVVEDDARRMLPADVGYHITRLRLRKTDGKVTQAALLEAGADAVAQAGLLADAGVDAVGFNCTGASVADGPPSARRLRDQVQEAARAPASTTILAVVRALRHRRVRKLVHVCPFTAEFGADEAAFLRAEGLEVVVSRGLNFTDARLAARLTPAEICDIALGTDSPDADGLFLSCANVRAWEAVAELERRLGKPAITSNQAMFWDLLDLVGHAGAEALIGGKAVQGAALGA